MPGKPFKRGHDERRSGGGAREGAGRRPDWLKEEIQEIGDPVAVVKFFYDVAMGIEKDTIVVNGKKVTVPAALRDRLRAGDQYLDRSVGKVPQAMEVTGANGSAFGSIPNDQLAECVKALRSRVAGGSGKGTRGPEGK